MEKVKVQKKRAPRWSEVEIDALVTAVESRGGVLEDVLGLEDVLEDTF